MSFPMDLLNLVAFFLFLAFVITLVNGWKRSKAAQKLPPSPWKLPIIGNIHHLLGSLPHYALKRLADKHGPLLHLQLGELSAIVVSSPRFAKEIMKAHDLAFANRPQLQGVKLGMYNCTDVAFAPYGDYWRQMRKICTMELLSPKTVRSFGPIRQDEALHLITSIQVLASAGEPINIAEKLCLYSSNMTLRAAFGKVSRDALNKFLRIMKEALHVTRGMELADLFPSYRILHIFSLSKAKGLKAHLKMDKLLNEIIHQHIDNLARTNMPTGEFGNEDLIDVLLRVKESGDLQVPITIDNIKAVVLDMFVGGIENSSTAVEWAMSELIRNPNVMTKAQSEIRKVFSGKKTIEESDIQELAYLKFVIKETMRLHPPVPLLVPRECREQCEIDGYTISIKTRVLINSWAIGRDPECWDEPGRFKPERFENSPVDFVGNHFEFLPFGAGRRICPAIAFALANVELPLALLLYHFDWNLPNGLSCNALDMTEVLGITACRKENLILLAKLYNPSFDM